MSYVVSIRRDRPITAAELRRATDDDLSFALVEEIDSPEGESVVLDWTGDEPGAEQFVLTEGVIDITTPSDEALAAAQLLAQRLGARVIGEEGEDLTDVALPGTPVARGCSPITWVLLLAVVLLGAYWLFA